MTTYVDLQTVCGNNTVGYNSEGLRVRGNPMVFCMFWQMGWKGPECVRIGSRFEGAKGQRIPTWNMSSP